MKECNIHSRSQRKQFIYLKENSLRLNHNPMSQKKRKKDSHFSDNCSKVINRQTKRKTTANTTNHTIKMFI